MLSRLRLLGTSCTFQTKGFTRSNKKIILTKDVPNLGFRGEICFVKPGFALNFLVPQKQALFFTDPEVKTLLTDPAELKRKQEMRNLELFLSKLKDIKLVFPREVSEINKNVAKQPVEAQEVLESLNKRYNMGIKRQDFKMEHSIDSIGEHFVLVTYTSELFQKDFAFYVKVQIRGKAKTTQNQEKAPVKATAKQ